MDHNDPFIQTLAELGRFLGQFPDQSRNDSGKLLMLNQTFYPSFSKMLAREPELNPWFTTDWIDRSLKGLSLMLEEKVLLDWLTRYEGIPVERQNQKTIGLVLAGNIPLVGFHDMLTVLAAGHRIQAKPSSKDDRLIKHIAKIIAHLDPDLGSRISFTEDYLKGVDAVIATGSNNSFRYFEYYFREIPHIIRKNRNGVAVLSGDETESELMALGKDIFTYFGLGCRSISKLYIPRDYDLKILLGILDNYMELTQHNKYSNNVDYYRSIYLMNSLEFLDNGVTLLKEDAGIASPVGVVFYERYSEIGAVQKIIHERGEEIQCIVSIHPEIENRVEPGKSQEPMPWDYADGVDTLKFLIELK